MQVVQGFSTMLDVPPSAFVSVNISQATQARRLLASSTSNATAVASRAVTAVIQPSVASNSTAAAAPAVTSLTAPTVARLLSSSEPAQSESALGFAVTQVTQSYRVGTCGNDVCEVGERGVSGNGSQPALLQGSCPDDCPVQYRACPSSQGGSCSARGSCLSSQGVCSCFNGWVATCYITHWSCCGCGVNCTLPDIAALCHKAASAVYAVLCFAVGFDVVSMWCPILCCAAPCCCVL